MDIATISILIITVSCIVGLTEWVRTIKNDTGKTVAQIRTLETKMNHIEEQLGELEKSEELIEATVHKAIEEKIVNEKTLALIQEKLKLQK